MTRGDDLYITLAFLYYNRTIGGGFLYEGEELG
jgi:hypothetical protein